MITFIVIEGSPLLHLAVLSRRHPCIQINQNALTSDEQVIQQTKKWVQEVVVGCNFCPFAAKVVKQDTIRYEIENGIGLKIGLESFIKACILMDDDMGIETMLIIFPLSFQQFDDYLDLVSMAEKLLEKEGYEGIYQVASFHPQYLFAGAPVADAANYTNRSVYPMLHILREASIEKALLKYPDSDQIPERNINFAREKGAVYMKMLRDSCV